MEAPDISVTEEELGIMSLTDEGGDTGVIEKLDPPSANFTSGAVPAGTEITLTAKDGAEIYYTIDQSDPISQSGKFTAKPYTTSLF